MYVLLLPDGCPALNVQQCPLLATCPYGLSTDRHGCQACSCRQPIACLPVSIQNCSIHCPRGRATGRDGCEVCTCRNTSKLGVCYFKLHVLSITHLFFFELLQYVMDTFCHGKKLTSSGLSHFCHFIIVSCLYLSLPLSPCFSPSYYCMTMIYG